jgi:hypothetical protein
MEPSSDEMSLEKRQLMEDYNDSFENGFNSYDHSGPFNRHTERRGRMKRRALIFVGAIALIWLLLLIGRTGAKLMRFCHWKFRGSKPQKMMYDFEDVSLPELKGA